MTTLQIIGLCRFSLLSYGGFQEMPEEIEARRAKLFDHQRLTHRLAWFKTVTLPTFARQSDPDFLFLVVTSAELPRAFLTALEDSLADFPQARLIKLPLGQHRDQCRQAIAAHINPDAEEVAQFRIDDDDGVAYDYIHNVRALHSVHRSAFRNHKLYCIDQCRGLLLTARPEEFSLQEIHAPSWRQALYFKKGDPRGVLDFPHHRAWRFMPVISYPYRPMFFKGRHDSNDGGEVNQFMSLPRSETHITNVLTDRFGLDYDSLVRQLSAVSA